MLLLRLRPVRVENRVEKNNKNPRHDITSTKLDLKHGQHFNYMYTFTRFSNNILLYILLVINI